MANAFDEFDEQPQTSGPVKITVGGNKPAASTGTVQAKPNAFDEFDQPQAKPQPSALEFGTDMAKHLGIGVLKGIPDLAKFVGSAPDVFAADRLGSTDEAGGADLAQRDRDMQSYLQSNFGPPDPNLPNGYTDQQRAQAWQAYQASGAYKPSPAATKNPSFGEMTEGALRAANLDPNVYFPTPEDPAQRVAEMAGSFGVQSMLGGELSVAQKLAQFGTGALAGGASQTLTEAVPEDWKPVTSFVSGMAIPMGLHAAGKGLGAGVKGAAEHVAPALPWSDKRKMAAQRLDSVINAPREQVINDLENAPELVPGSRPTAAKASADAGIGSFENALARNDDAFKAKLLQRQQENAAARVAPVHDIAEAQQPSAASDYFHSRMRELEQRADDLYNQHQSIADAEREAVGTGAPAADVGQRGRAALAQRFSQLNKEASELWKALPDDANVAAQPMKVKVGELYNSMGPEEALSLHPIETQIKNIINSYGDTINFGRFKELRSAITTAMRERDMNPKAKGRLSQVLNGVEDAVGQSIDQQVAAEQQAVAAGQMNPEDTLANRLHTDAQRVAGQGDMAGLSAGNEGAQAAPANAVPRDEGTRGAPDLGPAAPAGVQGLPQETGGDRFSVTAPDGRVTSVKARPDPARGLSAEDVLRQRFPDATITKETTNGAGNPAATARRPTLQPAEPRPSSEPGGPGSASLRAISGRPAREGDGSLKGLPRKPSPGITASGWPEAQRVAEDYMRKAGLPYDPPATYAKVDPARAKRIADAYDQMKHAPDDPEVKAAYDAMAKETLAQYQSIIDSGMTFDFIPKGAPDPYNGNPRNMTEDVRNNKHMWVYSTEDGFGSSADFDPKKNPLLADSGFKFGDRPATVNDIFRAVHDYFGHVKEGVGFRADGEENAWRAHSSMYSPLARKAMTTETRGQNSWVNYGPYGETNRTAKSEDTHYADQKTGLLPDWVVHEGAGDGTVFDKINEAFASSGVKPEEARANAAVAKSFYDVVAKSSGIPVDELYDMYPVEVRKSGEAPEGSLAQSGFYGDLETLAGKGAQSVLDAINANTALRNLAVKYVAEATGKSMMGSPNSEIAKAVSAAHEKLYAPTKADPLMDALKSIEGEINGNTKLSNADKASVLGLLDEKAKAGWHSVALSPGIELAQQLKQYWGLFGEKSITAVAKDIPVARAYMVDKLKELGWTDKAIDEFGIGAAVMNAIEYAHGKLIDQNAQKAQAASFATHASKFTNAFDHDAVDWDYSNNTKSKQTLARGILSKPFYDSIINDPNFQSFMEEGGITKYDQQAKKEMPLVVYHGAPNHGFGYFSGPTFFASDLNTSSGYGARELVRHKTPDEMIADPTTMGHLFQGKDVKVIQTGGHGKNIPYRIEWRDAYNDTHHHIDFPDRRSMLRGVEKRHAKPIEDRSKYGVGKSGVAPFFLRMENPYEIDFEGNNWGNAPAGEHDNWTGGGEAKIEHEVFFNGDHQKSFDDADEAQQYLSELIYDAASNFADEHRETLENKFSIIHPTPLFGDTTYEVHFDPEGETTYRLNDNGTSWTANSLEDVQAIIEDALDEERSYAEDAHRDFLNEDSSVQENEVEPEHDAMSTDDIVRWADNEGYDGVIFRNIEDGGPLSDVFVTLKPEQVKSPFNIGTFDPNDERFLFQSGYHSSPYDFSKFELSPRTVRSGEGNLDFGHGLYFATNDQARGYYRATVAGKDGHEYHVDLPENEELLHWDLPVSQQSSYVQDALNRLPSNYRPQEGDTGAKLYRRIANRIGDEAASEKLKDVGIPGHRYRDAGSRGTMPENKRTYNFVIYDDSRINILGKTPVAEIGQGGQRGAIDLSSTGAAIIHMLQNADASTGVHELSHQFLRMYQDMADAPHAPSSIRNDFNIVKDWWNKNAHAVAKDSGNEEVTPEAVRAALKHGTSGLPDLDAAINRGMQEQWARAFERYLRDGVAPTSALRGVFARFKEWLSSIYKNITSLNVDLSPEMKGVFDRMLGGGEAAPSPEPKPAPTAGPKMVTREQARQYAAARGATKNLKETFGTPTVKSILKRPGSTYAYDIGDEAVASKLWGAGAKGAGQVREVMGAAGNTPEIKQAVTDAAVNSLRTAAIKGGRLDPASLDAWRAKHADALSALPDLDRKLQSAGAAEKALVEVGQRRAEAIKAVQQSAIGKLLNVSADADVVKTIGTMLGKRDSVQSMRQLATQAKGNPDAVAGLQSALAQHLIDRMVTPKGAFRPDTFQRYISQNWPAMREVFSPEQMNTIRAIAADLKREAQSFVAPGGGSNTAENIAAARRYGVEQPTLMGKVWRTVIGPALSGVGAAVGLSPQGFLGQAIGGLGAALGTHVIERLREKGLETVSDLVREAMLDPKLFAELLKIAPKRANTGSHMSLAQYLATTGARAAVMTRAEGERRKEKKFANGGSVVGEDVYTSPPAWAADVVNRYLGQSQNAGVIPNQQSYGSA